MNMYTVLGAFDAVEDGRLSMYTVILLHRDWIGDHPPAVLYQVKAKNPKRAELAAQLRATREDIGRDERSNDGIRSDAALWRRLFVFDGYLVPTH